MAESETMNTKNYKRALEAGEESNRVKQTKTYENVKEYLEGEALEPEKYDPTKVGMLYKVPVMPYSGNRNYSKNCYFMTATEDVKFRHEGIPEACPPVFYIKSMIVARDKGRVHVSFTSSGSGKTVELASSSHTRQADLALLFGGIQDSDMLKNSQEKYYQLCKADQDAKRAHNQKKRTSHADNLRFETEDSKRADEIKQALEHRQEDAGILLVKSFREINKSQGTLHKIKAVAAKANQGLKIVVCLDEVYNCPVLVRSIIADRAWMAKNLRESLFRETKNVEIVFSCAGTGAARGSVGSNDRNFEVKTPVAKSKEAIWAIFEQGTQDDLNLIFRDGKTRRITYSVVEDHFPFIATLLKNGRMNSIACLCFNDWKPERTLDEAELLSNIIDEYIKSNGLNSLEGAQDQMLMGACAMATILFQPGIEGKRELPETPWEIEMFHSTGEAVGFKFEEVATRVPPNGVGVVQYLQGKLGLIEPGDKMKWESNGLIQEPFKMDRPQELVALKLLGIDLTQLLRLDPFGFEVVTTHLIKCALTAACVVKGKKKPTVNQALSKIGFAPHEVGNGKKRKTLTSKEVETRWNELHSWKPVFHVMETKDDDLHQRDTHFMSVELEVLVLPEGDGDQVTFKDHLQIDKGLYEVLSDMVKWNEQSQHGVVYAPFASINSGNSPMFDGSVTFFMRRVRTEDYEVEEETNKQEAEKEETADDLQSPKTKKLEEEEETTDEPQSPEAAFAAASKGRDDDHGDAGGEDDKEDEEDDDKEDEVKMCTIMNQAKDYAVDTKLKYAQLKDHAHRCHQSVLNGVFGENRLLCLSGRGKIISSPTARHSKYGRPHLPFRVNESGVMTGLLSLLDAKRSKKSRVEVNATIVDESGYPVVLEED